jgi:hypothetical protein
MVGPGAYPIGWAPVLLANITKKSCQGQTLAYWEPFLCYGEFFVNTSPE